jgi:hypothetical protein
VDLDLVVRVALASTDPGDRAHLSILDLRPGDGDFAVQLIARSRQLMRRCSDLGLLRDAVARRLERWEDSLGQSFDLDPTATSTRPPGSVRTGCGRCRGGT